MQFKTLQIGDDLREHISYSSHSIPLSICIDNFDEYFLREWSCHWHEEFEFATVLKGTVEYKIYDEYEQVSTKVLYEGDGIFINTGCLHSAKGIDEGSVLAGFIFPITFFDSKSFENLYNQNIRLLIESGITNLVLREKNEKDQTLLSSMKELCAITDKEIGFELHSIEMVCRIWRLLTIRVLNDENKVQISPVNKVHAQRLKEIVSFIHAHYGEHISVDDMASAAGISRTECFRSFQSVLKKTPTEYLTEYRMSMASMMLASTNRTISEIAFSCGFNTASYFSKLFREQTGVSPKVYREKSKKI